MALIEFTDRGLFCPPGNFYIDPWKPVEKAIITHAHSDHARFGSNSYLCHTYTAPILKFRLGDVHVETLEWNQPITMNGVKISLHPAGHIIGSSQIRIEYNGEVWVVSGDYKTEDDGISGAFEPVRCDTFITESTFALPIYDWKPQPVIYESIRSWISDTREKGKVPVLIGYSLGKAQRILDCIRETSTNLYAHGAVWNIHQVLVNAGFDLPELKRVTPDLPKETYRDSVIIAPGSADGTPWMKKFSPHSTGTCSGWMQVRGNVRRRNTDAGFALSDHADWKGLLQAVEATGASRVYATHGFQAAFSRYLSEKGIEAAEVKTEYGGEEEELEKPTQDEEQAAEQNTAGEL